MLSLIEPLVPCAVRAWNDYHHLRGAIKLTRLEVESLRKMIDVEKGVAIVPIQTENKREQEEWMAKIKRIIGLD